MEYVVSDIFLPRNSDMDTHKKISKVSHQTSAFQHGRRGLQPCTYSTVDIGYCKGRFYS